MLSHLNWKVDDKGRSSHKLTVDLNTAAVGLDDGLRQRQAQANALGVLGKAATVKPLEDMIQILRVDAAARILHGDRG